MSKLMSGVFQSGSRRSGNRQATSPQRRRCRPDVESLEGRQLLSVNGLDRVNTKVAFTQDFSDSASNGSGRKIVAWQDTYSSSDIDIRAQLYDAQGNRRGGEILVDLSSYIDTNPSVAIDDQGRFVVAWMRKLDGGVYCVMGRVYGADGAPQGGAFTVNPRDAWRSDAQFNDATYPDVAMDASGNFAVAYEYAYSPNDRDIWVRHYNAQGSQVVNVSFSSRDERGPSIAMTPGGDFIVAWAKRNGSPPYDYDIHAARFRADRSRLGAEMPIATGPNSEVAPDVAVNYWGEAVIVYQIQTDVTNWDVLARRVSTGNAVSLPISIGTGPRNELNPTVAMYRWGGDFLVAFDDQNYATPSSFGVTLVSVSSQNTRRWAYSYFTYDQYGSYPSVSLDASGNFLTSFTGSFYWQIGSSGRDIQRFIGNLFN